MIKTEVIAQIRVPGWHNWKDAPPRYEKFKLRHGHEFHIKVKAEVTHNNRQIEIEEMAEIIRSYLLNHYETSIIPDSSKRGIEFRDRSCEHICHNLYYNLSSQGNNIKGIKPCYVEVLEDGVNGACVSEV
jgi:6-pyruvoyl tetrahydropterin synthase-like protein